MTISSFEMACFIILVNVIFNVIHNIIFISTALDLVQRIWDRKCSLMLKKKKIISRKEESEIKQFLLSKLQQKFTQVKVKLKG